MKVILHPEARSEFFEAVEFYSNESTLIAGRFIAEFEDAANEICLHQTAFEKAEKVLM